jgi:hypothetical protein
MEFFWFFSILTFFAEQHLVGGVAGERRANSAWI